LQDVENYFNKFIIEIKKSKNSTYEDIKLLRFLEFCKEKVALNVNDRKYLHKKYLECLDAMINVEQIKEIKNEIQQKQKIETLEYYLKLKNGNPKWFINKLNELFKYHRLKTKCFQLDLNQIDDIISTVDQAYNDYNLSNEPPSIEIKSLINQQKSWAESILIRWQ
ncbi:4556_t:CDS:2, partial [Gigaspora rosea]